MTAWPRPLDAVSHAGRAAFFSAIIAAALWAGLGVREWIWLQTEEIRFNGDINNGFSWGKEALRVGYLNVYEEIGNVYLAQKERRRLCDYAPLRLGVMSLWTQWLYDNGAPMERRIGSAAYHRPLLRFNTTMELLSCLAAFLIVRKVVRRKEDDPPFWRGASVGLIAALLTWFNPVIIYNAHAWPQWDVWAIPFFLFAVYFGLKRWWLLAGLVLGIGANLKGQVLVVAWTLPVWSIIVVDWRSVCRLLSSIASRFTDADAFGLRHVLSGAADDLLAIGQRLLPPLQVGIGLAAGVAIVGIPWELSRMADGPLAELTGLNARLGRIIDWKAIAWVALWLGAATLLPRRFSPTLVFAALAIALWLTMPLNKVYDPAHPNKPPQEVVRIFNGTDYWLQSGFGIGTVHYQAMYMGPVSNLPALLSQQFGFQGGIKQTIIYRDWARLELRTPLIALLLGLGTFTATILAAAERVHPARRLGTAIGWIAPLCASLLLMMLADASLFASGEVFPETWRVTLKSFMLTIFIALAAIAAIFAGINDRRRDPRLVLAITLPWLLFYLMPLQIHERYMLYIAACTGLFAACGLGWTLLGVALAIVALLPTVQGAFGANGIGKHGLTHEPFDLFMYLHNVVAGTHAGIAWLSLLAAAMMLYAILPPRTKGI